MNVNISLAHPRSKLWADADTEGGMPEPEYHYYRQHCDVIMILRTNSVGSDTRRVWKTTL